MYNIKKYPESKKYSILKYKRNQTVQYNYYLNNPKLKY